MKLPVTLLLAALAAPLAAPAQTTLTFSARAALPAGGRYAMAYCQDQRYFYMIGGGHPASAFSSEVFRYDPVADSWGAGALSTGQVPEQRLGKAVLTGAGTAGARIYVLNGADLNGPVATMPSLLPASGALALSLSNATPAAQAGLAEWNGRLYAFGGQLASGLYTNELRAYDPGTGNWTTLAAMPEAKTTYGAAVGGKIYAVGGYNGLINSNRIDVYDPATNRWQAAARLPTTVSNQAVVVQGEWLWLIGDFTNQTYLAAYNTRTGQLRTFTSNLPGRRNAAAAIYNDQLYVWGGNTAAANASTLADMWVANVGGVLAAATAAPRPRPTAYPNPSASGEFTLPLPPDAQTVEVRDALGRLVYTATPPARAASCQLPLGAQPAGVYSVRVGTRQGLSAPCQLLRP